MSSVLNSGSGRDSRVLLTGIGLTTGLGANREDSWAQLRSGRHGFSIDKASPDGFWLDVAREAATDAGLHPEFLERDRAGVVFGLSKGHVQKLLRFHDSLRTPPVDRLDCSFLEGWPHAGAVSIRAAFGFGGPCLAPIAACATGLIAALQGADLIRRGVCDVVLAGAADASLHPFLLGAFRKMGVLARQNEGDDPGLAVRPWDRNRSGFLVGEGAAVLVLESEKHARARGVLPYAELCGGAFGADAFHMTDLNPDPMNLAGLIGRSLENAGVNTSEIDHVNVHGTATLVNDPLECQALRLTFGNHANKLACSANKAQIGHLLGAAGAVELAFTALAIRDGFAPPTVNLDDPDPLCDLDGTPNVGRSLTIRGALKLSIGFGGHLAAAVLKQADEPRRAPR